ncbi:YolD-like family protein [Bacillus sp. B15-48]|uniref:YolD-like family protein n=1 Tax=Bacillus sp. B15-48 TaxID=1548601 RepID=UPI00193FCA63|nr:YolD-like family protein [Bacillus sp. B15-48]MBM4762200.1 YolD-like family protein [Bacillus sp. B15-48]
MIRDRGRIKWTSMMLPEHVKMLRDWAREDETEAEKELDEQQLELMNEIIFEAMELKKFVVITYYHKQKYKLVIGKIRGWDQLKSKLRIADRFEDFHDIGLSSIVDVRIVEE